MSALSDLQAAATTVVTAINSAITLIGTLQSGNADDPQVEAVVAQLNTASANLTAALTPPPPPAA